LRDRDLLGARRREQLRAIDRETLAGVLDQAVLAATITCTRSGAQPPTAEELRAALRDSRNGSG
ncbi:MAG TPA: carbohydrate kinase, partial [Actinomycetes bacterium]